MMLKDACDAVGILTLHRINLSLLQERYTNFSAGIIALKSELQMVHFYDLNECLQVGNENGRCYALSRWNDKLQVLSKDDYVALLTRQTSLLGYSIN